jgi:hypothetical protein
LLGVAYAKFIYASRLMKGEKIKLHPFFTLALDVSELSASCSSS